MPIVKSSDGYLLTKWPTCFAHIPIRIKLIKGLLIILFYYPLPDDVFYKAYEIIHVSKERISGLYPFELNPVIMSSR